MTASLWQSSIGTDILEKNLCCITLSPQLISLPILQEVSAESPQFSTTLHSFILHDDFMPYLTMFLDLKFSIMEKLDYRPLPSIKVKNYYRVTLPTSLINSSNSKSIITRAMLQHSKASERM